MIQAVNNSTSFTPLVAEGSTSTPALSFGDVLDAVNPLQHIPVVSSAYNSLSGNNISTAAQTAGDALYGVLTGGTTKLASLASTGVNAAVKAVTGKDITGNVLNTLNPSAAAPVYTPLVANTPEQTLAANNNTTSPTANFIPLSQKTTAIAAGQYQKAMIMSKVNQKLVHVTG